MPRYLAVARALASVLSLGTVASSLVAACSGYLPSEPCVVGAQVPASCGCFRVLIDGSGDAVELPDGARLGERLCAVGPLAPPDLPT